MNSLLLYPEEISNNQTAHLTGARASEVFSKHALSAGIEIKVGVYRSEVRSGFVVSASPDEVVIELRRKFAPPARENLELIIALPRPQTLKKILQLSATCGIAAVHLVPAEKVPRSYFQSKLLRDESILKEIALGLQQAGDCFPPLINISNFSSNNAANIFENLKAAQYQNALKLFADTIREDGGRAQSAPSFESAGQKVVLAIGPEGGWTENERRRFIYELNFQPYSLGDRQLRTEVALSMILGQVKLLRTGTSVP